MGKKSIIYSEEQITRAFKLYNEGVVVKTISKEVGIPYSSVFYVLNCYGSYKKYENLKNEAAREAALKAKAQQKLLDHKNEKEIRNYDGRNKDQKNILEYNRRTKAEREAKVAAIKKEKDDICKDYENGMEIDAIADKYEHNSAYIESILIGHKLLIPDLDTTNLITKDKLAYFRDNILEVGQIYLIRRLRQVPSKKPVMISKYVKVTGIYPGFVETNDGSYQYVDLYKSYCYMRDKAMKEKA